MPLATELSPFDFPTMLGPQLNQHMTAASSTTSEPGDRTEDPLRRSGRREHWLADDLLSEAAERELTEVTLRTNLRYQVEFIEAFNLCPWAKGARTSNNAVPRVDDGSPLLTQIANAAALGADVVFLILPTYVGGRLDFEDLVARLIAEDARRHRDVSPPFAMAAFHPEGVPQPEGELSSETLVPYLRRSPDPTIQLVRLEALAQVRKGEPPGTSFIDPSQIDFAELLRKGVPTRPSLRQRVANANHALFVGTTGDDLRRTLEDILDERRRARQRLGLPLSPWERP